LFQVINGQTRYIAFASKVFNKTQRDYPITKREFLAVIFALSHFRKWLRHYKFTLLTDHMSLKYLLDKKKGFRNSAVIENWLHFLSEFEFDVQYINGIANVLPDFLSRYFEDTDGVVQNLEKVHLNNFDSHQNSWFPESADQPHKAKSQLAKFISERFEKYTPEPDRRYALLQTYHNCDHLGAHHLFNRLWNDNIYWPAMLRDCKAIVNNCSTCLHNNVQRQGFHPLKTIDAKYPWDHIIMDIAQPVLDEQGEYKYILVLVDVSTRFVILKKLISKDKQYVARKLFSIFSTLGFPKILQSDNGGEFNNQLLSEMMRSSQQRFSIPYIPHHNGLAERTVGITKLMLRKFLFQADIGDLWHEYIPAIQLMLNIKIAKKNMSSPFSLMFLRPCYPPGDYSYTNSDLISPEAWLNGATQLTEAIFPALEKNRKLYNEMLAKQFGKRHKIFKDKLPVGTRVMRVVHSKTGKMDTPYSGPYTIIQVLKEGYYLRHDNGEFSKGRVAPNELKVIIPKPKYINTQPEEILGHSQDEGSKEIYYLVKWSGYPLLDATWVRENDFPKAATAILDAYEAKSRRRGDMSAYNY